MEEKSSNTFIDDSPCLKQSETEQSFVGKVKSIITNTPLSKWFRKENTRPTIRRRDEDCEDDAQEMQPPSKRVKLPVVEKNNYSSVFSETIVHNEVKKLTKICDYYPEPVAGPSGIHTNSLANGISVNSVHNRLTNSDILSRHKDSDSEESTSGYSSAVKVGNKEQVYQSPSSSKQTTPNQKTSSSARTLFHTTAKSGMNQDFLGERSTSTHLNASLSSRRPSFNASTFGSPNFVDRTLLTKKIINSPFYNGRTVYGGASAYGHNLGRTQQDLRKNLKTSIQIKPVNKNNENRNLVLGKTARRILETLEQYSSPVNDAKKIPVVSKKSREDGILTKYVGANPYIKKGASNRELNVPSVADLLKIKQKNKLQDTTEAVRQIATTSKSNLNAESYKLGGDTDKDKHTSKMKTKVTNVRQKVVTEEHVPEVNLQPVTLPITSLPKFDFVVPPPILSQKSKESPQKLKPATNKESSKETALSPIMKTESQKTWQKKEHSIIEKSTGTKELSKSKEYKFSNPLVIAENLKSITAINNFKFSEPVCKRKKIESANVSVNFKMPENKIPTLTPKPKSLNQPKPEPMLKTGSVMDILSKKDSSSSLLDKFKPPSNSWECSACLVRNTSEKSKCIACETPMSKAPSNNTGFGSSNIKTFMPSNDQGFGSQFIKSSDKWECPICMIQNTNSDLKCVACTAAKPTVLSNAIKKQFDFGDKFKLPSDMWECSVCMVRNKNDLKKCASCESPSPNSNIISSNGFGNNFKPPASTWECTTCLVRNKEEDTKCIACETSRINVKPAITDNFGGSFKMKTNEWECGVCMVRNKAENSKCQCCETPKPGAMVNNDTPKEKPISTFNFGIDKASATSFNFGIPPTAKVDVPKLDIKPSSVFGDNAKTTSTEVTGGFSFGIPSDTKEKEKSTESKPVVPEVQQRSNPLLKPTEKLPEPAKSAPPGFQFGITTSSTDAQPLVNQTIPKLTKSILPETSNLIALPIASKNEKEASVFANKVNTDTNTTSVTKPSTQPVNTFSFGSKPSTASTPLLSTQIDDKKSESNQSVSSTSIFKFGSPSKPVTNAVAAPIFGSSIVSSSNTDCSSTFSKADNAIPNKTTIPNATEVKPFSFVNSATKSEEPPKKVSMFSFEQKSQVQPTTQIAAQPSSKPSGFSFSASNSAPSFNFGGAKPESSSNIFGGGNNIDKTPNGTTPTFNFGSSTNNAQKAAGFSFGANPASSTTAQTGFNFGSAATLSAPSAGGFNFSAAPPAFNANAKPSFNFSAGSSLPSFTAQPTVEGTVLAGRKIKKAFRRTHR